MMEWAIGILTFVGISFTVLLEVWINWDPTISFTARSRPHWLVLVIAINWEKSGSGGSRSDR